MYPNIYPHISRILVDRITRYWTNGKKNPPFLEGFWTAQDFPGLCFGGERGIRTPVRAFGPQIDFESIPLRPLRYLSGYRRAFTASPLASFPEKIHSKFRSIPSEEPLP